MDPSDQIIAMRTCMASAKTNESFCLIRWLPRNALGKIKGRDAKMTKLSRYSDMNLVTGKWVILLKCWWSTRRWYSQFSIFSGFPFPYNLLAITYFSACLSTTTNYLLHLVLAGMLLLEHTSNCSVSVILNHAEIQNKTLVVLQTVMAPMFEAVGIAMTLFVRSNEFEV